MALESLRKYLLATEYSNYNLTDVDTYTLIQAEQDVDNLVANNYRGPQVKKYGGYEIEDNVTLTTTTATLPNSTATDGYYSYMVLEILTGANKGLKIPIQSSVNNVLTFFSTQAGLSGTVSVNIYQYGKFPMFQDCKDLTNIIYKPIIPQVKQAVAEQYKFRIANPDLFNSQTKVVSGYSVNGANYSENYAVGKNGVDHVSPKDLVAPVVFQLLDDLGLTITLI